MTRRKGLSAEDSELWAFVTREITPLKRRRRKPAVAKAATKAAETLPEPAAAPAKPPVKPKSAAGRPAKPPAAPPMPPIAPIDKRERRQVVRGTRAIDARIDLHGMRQAEAHGALRGFLAIAQMRGYSMVLVITGKGGGGGGDMAFSGDERGVLRRVVPQWLRMPDLRPLILGFEEAHHGHGGSGALYVRLRRIRRIGER
ncbi:DNA mismatch repair protein MutS [Labrys okinawensis]|uniref:DNA mismatch repair protein MutS n=1 Tax=Labrys okinawensis TaxID=346911 RepID=A0A2S9Q775_9HYPH|nr:Smr/MutS family protein [Labrys okinawensis]PRH85197.1 DNA mismatch repair protein MutS [Labrys okinawensis]